MGKEEDRRWSKAAQILLRNLVALSYIKEKLEDVYHH
jgi:hypothetical protein